MSFNDSLKSFFSDEVESVVDDADKFRKKLQIGSEAFKYLTKADNLGTFLTVLGGGGVASLGVTAAWATSLGVLGNIGLAIGAVSTPIGWIALAGTGGAAAVYGVKKLFKSVRQEAVTEVPNFINSPIDVLASSIFGLIAPILLKIAFADKEFSADEYTSIVEYFVSEWGLNRSYVESNLKTHQDNLNNFSYEGLTELIDSLAKTGDIKKNVLASEIMRVCDEVTTADGLVCKFEKAELELLKKAIG